ncbi:ATP-binding protein [Fodinicurvata sp. EGI_FJ10296]|uniref:hybrid sensor histidine kinase/response regulator n=1 Tax=Fodinicurvata sp. EGI_FJ10296 TaxID=3231908 RepID=UPI003455B839
MNQTPTGPKRLDPERLSSGWPLSSASTERTGGRDQGTDEGAASGDRPKPNGPWASAGLLERSSIKGGGGGAPPPHGSFLLALVGIAASLATALAAATNGVASVWLAAGALLAAVSGTAAVAGFWFEQQRRAKDGWMRSLLEHGYDETAAGHILSAPDDSVVHANTVACRLVSSPSVDSVDRFEQALAADRTAAARFQRLRRAVRGGSPFTVELPRVRETGTDWWLVSARPIASWPGYIHWRIEDITSRREMEAILREEQVKLVDFMDHAPVGFYSVDFGGKFLFANATLAEWLGVEARDLVRGDYSLHDFLVEPPATGPSYALDPSKPDAEHVEIVMRGADMRQFHASIAQTVVHGDDGASVWTRSVVRDLTVHRQMSEALRLSEMRFQRFFKEAPIGIVLLDRSLKIFEWNKSFADLVRSTGLQELQGRGLADFFDMRSGGLDLSALLNEALETGRAVPPVELHIKGRSEMIASAHARRMDAGSGDDDTLLVQFIDQTEQKALEAQFAQSQKMQAVGQLAGGIAHDFNNLLTAMIGFCDLLLLRHKPGDPSFGDIMQIKQNANRAANLVRQLLAFSRQQTLQPRVLDITDVLAELSNLLRRLIGENIDLRMTHGRDLGLVRVDQGQLEQVIINLAVNARDAMSGGGRLEIRTGTERLAASRRIGSDEIPAGDYVVLEVEDTGVGIPRENLVRIFDPFFSTKEVGSGTGLGLSTVYGIVRQTGGYVQVDSTVDVGTRFAVYLPRHVPEAATARAADPESDADAAPRDLTGAGRILLVEDEDPVRVFAARALRNKGYAVVEARTGPEALTALDREEAFDLLITDVVMPQMDGPALIRKVRERDADLKVICISGYTEDRFRADLAGIEGVDFMAKPFSLKQLAGKVKDALRAN